MNEIERAYDWIKAKRFRVGFALGSIAGAVLAFLLTGVF